MTTPMGPETMERPLRLVQFVRSFHIGGTEVQVLELLRGLPEGYQVRVGVLEAAGPLMEELSDLGHTPTAFPLHGSLMRAGTAHTILRIALWLKAQQADLVHVHDFYSILMVIPAARMVGCKVVVGRLDLAHWHGTARRVVYAQATRLADHVIANADAIRTMLMREERIPGHRISVIHNGLDVARFDQRLAAGLDAPLPDTRGAPLLVHVANMSHPVKRQEELLTALRLLRNQGMHLHTFLVGDGPRRPGIEARARELGLSDSVHFLGHRKDVPAIYAKAQLGVLCSAAEGLSNAVMEGMAARLPMVVTRVGGNPDLIEDGRRGRVVEPGQPEQLAGALGHLLAQPATGRRMGRAARRFVEQELSLGRMISRHDALYRRLVRPAYQPSLRPVPVRV